MPRCGNVAQGWIQPSRDSGTRSTAGREEKLLATVRRRISSTRGPLTTSPCQWSSRGDEWLATDKLWRAPRRQVTAGRPAADTDSPVRKRDRYFVNFELKLLCSVRQLFWQVFEGEYRTATELATRDRCLRLHFGKCGFLLDCDWQETRFLESGLCRFFLSTRDRHSWLLFLKSCLWWGAPMLSNSRSKGYIQKNNLLCRFLLPTEYRHHKLLFEKSCF